MKPLESYFAWRRRKAQETLAAIDKVSAGPDSPSRTAELQVLTEALGRYIVTTETLETAVRALQGNAGSGLESSSSDRPGGEHRKEPDSE